MAAIVKPAIHRYFPWHSWLNTGWRYQTRKMKLPKLFSSRTIQQLHEESLKRSIAKSKRVFPNKMLKTNRCRNPLMMFYTVTRGNRQWKVNCEMLQKLCFCRQSLQEIDVEGGSRLTPVGNATLKTYHMRRDSPWMPSSVCERARETKRGRQRCTLNWKAINMCAAWVWVHVQCEPCSYVLLNLFKRSRYIRETLQSVTCRCIWMSFCVLGGVLVVKEITCII